MTTTTETPSETIRRLAAECIAEAQSEGWTGDGYELTAADCEAIDDGFASHHGRRPTKADWTDAGYPHVGGAHYER